MAKMKRAEPLGLDGPGDAVVFFLGVVLVGVLVGVTTEMRYCVEFFNW